MFREHEGWGPEGSPVGGPPGGALVASPLYDDRGSLVPSLYWPAIVIAGAGLAISAWYIADWAGRL